MPRAFSAFAMPRSPLMPEAWISRITPARWINWRIMRHFIFFLFIFNGFTPLQQFRIPPDVLVAFDDAPQRAFITGSSRKTVTADAFPALN